MLHWLYIFSFFLLITLFSFILVNKSLLQLVLLSEVVLIFIMAICCVGAAIYNTYILVGFSLVLLILGGLELSLNLLLLSINVTNFFKKNLSKKLFFYYNILLFKLQYN